MHDQVFTDPNFGLKGSGQDERGQHFSLPPYGLSSILPAGGRRDHAVFANIDRQTLQQPRMKYWESAADKLSAAGWSWGYCSAVTRQGWRWIVDAHKATANATLSNLMSCLRPFWSWKRRCCSIFAIRSVEFSSTKGRDRVKRRP